MKAIIFSGKVGRCVLYGDVDELPLPDTTVVIFNARMVLRVASVGFVGLGSKGPKPDTDTRIGRAVPRAICTARQAVECTEEAAQAIDAWPEWA